MVTFWRICFVWIVDWFEIELIRFSVFEFMFNAVVEGSGSFFRENGKHERGFGFFRSTSCIGFFHRIFSIDELYWFFNQRTRMLRIFAFPMIRSAGQFLGLVFGSTLRRIPL